MMVCCLDRLGPGDAGTYGDYRCNVPESTVSIALEKIAAMNADMYVFSGDAPPHRAWNETKESQYACISRIAQLIKDKLPGKIVYTTIGNHDNYPTNEFSIANSEYTPGLLDLYLNLYGATNKFGPDQIATMKAGGYYTMTTEYFGNNKKFRLVVINSNYAYTLNVWNPYNLRSSKEGAVMKTEIDKTLKAACANNEWVIMIIHHSIGDYDFINTEAIYWQDTIVNYSSCIKLVLSGHSHIDEFRLIKDSSNALKNMVYISGSVDSHDYKNPSVRRYFLDKETAEVLDYDVHYLNLKNVPSTGDPPMEMLYSARKEYQLADMSPSSWEDLLCRFSTEPEMLAKHLNHGSEDAVINPGACGSNCTRDHSCRQQHSVYSHYVRCSDADQMFSFYALDVGKFPHAPLP